MYGGERSREENCKIRKRRNNNSSSSSSSVVQKYRFKRAILVGKRGGPTTPVPTWMMMMTTQKSPNLASPGSELGLAKAEGDSQNGGVVKAKEVSVSARKLAATLWEINKAPSFGASEKDLDALEDKKELKGRERIGKLVHLSDPSDTPATEGMSRSRGHGRHSRKASLVSKKQIEVAKCFLEGFDPVNGTNSMEIETYAKARTGMESVTGIRTRLKDVSTGLTTSKELLKVLNRVCGLDEQHSPAMSLVSALRVELDRARIQVDQLIKDQRSQRDQIEHLMKHFEEEKAAWRRKERERIRDALSCIAEELEVERKLRKQTERLNKKLGKELADTKASLSKAVKELESEKRAKDVLEQVCDELASGIGEDRAEVEELKRESAKVREEVEQEREMLHLADVLREERVQMKLSEARYQFEEKNAVVDRLRIELEIYLKKKRREEDVDDSPDYERIKELEAYLKEISFGSCKKSEREDGAVGNGELLHGDDDDDDDDSADSDFHSIELSMDNNSKSYRWGYACGADVPKVVALEKDIRGRKSISENIQWEKICLHKEMSRAINGTNTNSVSLSKKIPELSIGERLFEHDLHSQMNADEDGIDQHKSVKSLRDHILQESKFLSGQKFASPTCQWSQSLPLLEPGSADGSPVLQGENLRHFTAGTKNEHQISASSRC